MTRITLGIVTTLALAAVFPAAAQAQNGSLTRSFVSSTGVDTNGCTITAPCATFAQAYTKISANGIVTALDPGKYGPLSIIGPVTIDGNGWASITAPANSYGVGINAQSTDTITLKGLNIDGVGTANYGVYFNTGGGLNVFDCNIKNIYNYGIWVGAISPMRLVVSGSLLSNIQSGAGFAIYFINGTNSHLNVASIDRVTVIGSGTAVALYAETGPIQAMITHSEFDDDSIGVLNQGTSNNNTVNTIMRDDDLSDVDNGIQPLAYAAIYLSQVVQTQNDIGITDGGTNIAVYSDNTNHLGSTYNVTLSPWTTQ
jgi:hypothetical protein